MQQIPQDQDKFFWRNRRYLLYRHCLVAQGRCTRDGSSCLSSPSLLIILISSCWSSVAFSIDSGAIEILDLAMALSRIGGVETLSTLTRVSRVGTNLFSQNILFRFVFTCRSIACNCNIPTGKKTKNQKTLECCRLFFFAVWEAYVMKLRNQLHSNMSTVDCIKYSVFLRNIHIIFKVICNISWQLSPLYCSCNLKLFLF